ncbi:hypothetical protein B6S44_01685 [Bosea sp. Tri-44]|uniref:S8 family peptidase n=1 Tax=Bosea sp. Tri-44 TaxID=1972137 RepID=UPI00100FA424|nr:S8 family peptidase [Bosea sp. Tri-44]RXT57177.1 hypothetical protein B6S44_01685 [Bosea sp. Tri-44]
MATQGNSGGRRPRRNPSRPNDALIEAFVFETFGVRRFLQDGPVRSDVWLRYLMRALADRADERTSLILSPKLTAGPEGQRPASTADLADEIVRRLGGASTKASRHKVTRVHRIAVTSRYVIVDLTFTELVHAVLPLTQWWRDNAPRMELRKLEDALFKPDGDMTVRAVLRDIDVDIDVLRFGALITIIDMAEKPESRELAIDLMGKLVVGPGRSREDDDLDDDPMQRSGRRSLDEGDDPPGVDRARIGELNPLWQPFQQLMQEIGQASELPAGASGGTVSIWSIARNRLALRMELESFDLPPARLPPPCAALSRDTVKADAAIRLFDLSTRDFTWAVIDTGIDPKRAVFRDWRKTDHVSRVTRSLDFTRLRRLMSGQVSLETMIAQLPLQKRNDPTIKRQIQQQFSSLDALARGVAEADWSIIAPLLEVDPDGDDAVPDDEHGTHVAAILGGCFPVPGEAAQGPFYGVCPDIRLLDLRVFGRRTGEGEESGGDEFTILAALDYLTWLNRNPELPQVHGVNMSVSIRHLVDAHACGRTPICEAVNRLVALGTPVVTAAGNAGFDPAANKVNLGFGYRGMSITDPGNADGAICVGATHRADPHSFGVSYFSSRGPTGDGRLKPDLVAPGEKIVSAIPGNGDRFASKDGTSMAAPHVSGVCALLMARHRELIGRPERIKQILIRTATDLGRERYFQGAGLVDALRALQSV